MSNLSQTAKHACTHALYPMQPMNLVSMWPHLTFTFKLPSNVDTLSRYIGAPSDDESFLRWRNINLQLPLPLPYRKWLLTLQSIYRYITIYWMAVIVWCTLRHMSYYPDTAKRYTLKWHSIHGHVQNESTERHRIFKSSIIGQYLNYNI